jgi:hypothetical protein
VGKSKSKDQSFECVLVGYSPSTKAYRLYHRVSHRVIESFHVDFIERKDDVAVSHCPGQIVNTIDSSSPTVSTFHDPVSLPDSSSIVDSSPVSASVSKNISSPSQVSDSISVLGPLPTVQDSIPISLPSPTTLHTDSLDNLSSSSLPNPEPVLPKCVSKPSARKLAAMDKETALLANISTYLLELDAGNEDAKQHLAYALDDLSKLPDVAYDDSVPAPGDPKTYREAMNGPDAEQWTASMEEELASLKKYEVYKLVPQSAVPANRKVLRGQWVFCRKVDSSGNTTRYKSCYIFGSNRQVPGWDYDRTSAPTARAKAF